MQKNREAWRPVAYASRSLSDTERRYAQIEKEGLAITWACERFSTYILGKRIVVETAQATGAIVWDERARQAPTKSSSISSET